MEAVGVAALIVLAVLAAVGGWLFVHSLDKGRITDYVEQRGGRVVSVNWAPFGRGWFGEKEERLYEVVYYDSAGNQHFATAKTSMLTGVYWTEDRVTHAKAGWYDAVAPGNPPGKPLIRQLPQAAEAADADELRRLREENERLREQVAELTGAAAPSRSRAAPPAGPPSRRTRRAARVARSRCAEE
jgi:hypothetical protein